MLGRLALALVVVLAAVVIVSLWWWSGSAEEIVPDVAPEGRAMEEVALPEPGADSSTETARDRRSVEATERATEEELDVSATIVVTGGVVDEARFPVPGAAVDLVIPGSGTLSTRTDEAGRFRIEGVVLPPDALRQGFVRATDEQDRIGVTACFGLYRGRNDGEERDLGTVVLSSANTVQVSVLRRGAPLPGARVVAKDPGYVAGILAEATTDALGRAVLDGLPAAWLAFEASAPGSLGEVNAILPDPEQRELVIEMKDQRSVEVLVIDTETKQGVAGADVVARRNQYVPGLVKRVASRPGMEGEHVTIVPVDLDVSPTDAEGRTWLEGLPAGGYFELSATAAGFHQVGRSRGPSVRLEAGVTRVTIELQRDEFRTVRWPLVGGDVPAPSEGSVIALRKKHREFGDDPSAVLPPTGIVSAGALVAEDVSRRNFQGVATAPDGSLARLRISEEKDVGSEVSFRRPRRIEVRVFEAGGEPCPGASARLTDQGNNAFTEPVLSDEEGLAVLEDLLGDLVEVRVLPPGEIGRGKVAGTVDLREGDGALEVHLDPRLELRLRVRLEGRPGLPGIYTIWSQSGLVRVLHEDPRLAELSLAIVTASKGELSLLLRADGYLPGRATIDLGASDEIPVAEIDLERSRTLRATMDRPEKRRIEVQPERWDEESGSWKMGGHFYTKMNWPNGPHGSFVFTGLEPGRYRVHELQSGVTSEAVELVDAVHEALVHLDLSATCRVNGRIEAPAGTELQRCLVLTEGEELDGSREEDRMPGSEPPEGTWVNAKGEFTVTVPGDRPITLRPWHAWLSPAEEGGIAVVEGERDGVVLRLVAADEVRFSVPELAGDQRRAEKGLRVFQYEGEPSGKPLGVFHAPIADGVARFSGLPPGTWTLWIDPGRGLAPLTLRDVRVDAGVTILPEPEFGPGSTLRIRVLVPDGTDHPRVYVSAWKLEEPAIHRDLNSRGDPVVLVPGLDAGRYRVSMSKIMEMGREPGQEIEVDGVTDMELELDLR